MQGGFTITGSGYLQMGNDNDYMLTEGNFLFVAIIVK